MKKSPSSRQLGAFEKSPNIYAIHSIRDMIQSPTQCTVFLGGQHHMARPIGDRYLKTRLRAAWLVFTGRADAVVWGGGQ